MRLRIARMLATKRVTPATGLIAISVLVVFVSWSAYSNFLSPPRTAPLDANGRVAVAFFKAMAKKYGADVSKLSPAERARLNEITHGRGGALPLRMAQEGKFDF